MNRRFLLGLLLTLGVSSSVFADGMNQVVSPTTANPRWTVTVFNDSASTLTSGDVVVWDNDDTEFDQNGYPYVTTTTTADVDWVAGVVLSPSCADQTLCEIIVYGPAITRMAYSTDAPVEDTTVATTTIAGVAGDWDGGANDCYLGLFMLNYDPRSGNTPGSGEDGANGMVFVNPGCED